MLNEAYRYKCYLNASCLITQIIDGEKTYNSQPHTWEFNLSVISIDNQYIAFKKIEEIINEILAPYQNKILDEIKPFDRIIPNVRNICHILKKFINEKLLEINCIVLCYEIYETPSSSYIFNNIENLEYYKYKLYLNASHSILLNNNFGQTHQHSFEINAVVINQENDFSKFRNIEKKLEKILAKYQYKNLNEMEEFQNINPTLEFITNYFENVFEKNLLENNCTLSSIEIAETPSISYILN